MTELAMGFSDKSDRYPPRGERIAAWVERYMREQRLSVGELAFKVRADKRDLRRLLTDRNCGSRLNDALEEAFEWDFIEQVATPVVGADPITSRERAIERNLAQAAALHSQVERDRAVRTAYAPRLALVAGGAALPGSRTRGPARPFDPPAPESA